MKPPKYFLIFVVLLTFTGCRPSSVSLPPQEQVVCTQEARECPDGSFVGRSGPNCEFAACPESATARLACGFLDGKQVDCPAGQMCATFDQISSEPTIRCLPNNFCDTACATDEECVVAESWPLQIHCVKKENTEGLIKPIKLAPGSYQGRADGSEPTNPQSICMQDAKVCPDGSTVERSGPNCEFAPCPNAY